MLSRRHRMGKNEFGVLSRSGRRISGAYLNLSFIKAPTSPSSAFTFVVAKKIAPSSPLRNRLRRRGYEALREHWGDIPHPIVAAFYAKAAARTASYDALRGEIISLISRI